MEKAFLIGSNENLIDICFWWLDLKRKYAPNIPVQIVDFGLLPGTIKRLELAGHLVLPLKTRFKDKHVWFSKPRAMLETKAEITCWMDIDTEFVQDPTDIFDLAQDEKIGLVPDQYYHSVNRPMHNSGVVLFKKRPKILYAWDSAITTSSQRGDQEVLKELLERDSSMRNLVFDLPDKYNYVRIMFQSAPSRVDDLRVIHWTGNQGKRIIRGPKKMGALKEPPGTMSLGHDYRGDENQYKP